ncbi:MAG: aldo/keto reductase [Elusimicrobiales bacterium]|nr:aldo/keto reductase [Elusimicrobiales bacterium]
MKIQTIKLNNGVEMPMEDFGVFQVPDGNAAQKAVEEAINAGYRFIDTAAAYMNEEAVGRAIAAKIADGTVKRQDLFITTKVWVQDAGEKPTHEAFEASLKKLGLDYLDLYLIHQPMGDYYGSWRAMQQLYSEGRIKAIGVCNMYPHVLMDFCVHSKVIPAVNQVELHPFFQQEKAVELMKELGVVPEAWGPFAEGKHGIFANPLIESIAAKHGKTPAQAILRWNVQRGVVVIPKSVHKERMEQNINIWDFSLDEEDMEEMSSLDLGHSEIVNHCDPNFVKMVGGWKIH